MLDDYEYYVSKLKKPSRHSRKFSVIDWKSIPITTPCSDRQVTLCKNSLKILIDTASPGTVLKEMEQMLMRDADLYDRVVVALEKDKSIRNYVEKVRPY